MAGYADIDEAAPLGSDAVAVSAEFRGLKADLLDGVGVEHSDGQSVAGEQGEHAFPRGNAAALPATANRPTGHLFFVKDATIADTLVPYNNEKSVAQQLVGTAWLTKVDSVATVADGAATDITIQAYAASHRDYTISIYTNGVNNPAITFGNDISGGTDIYAWIVRTKGGNDVLHLRNDSGNSEDIHYRVRQVIVG